MADTDDKKDDMPIIDTGPVPKGGADHPDAFPAATTESSPDEGELTPEMAALTDDLVGALKSVYDPEIPVDVYELGLIYRVDVSDARDVTVDMTLTAPGCPVAGEMPGQVARALAAVKCVGEVSVELVWSPPWTPDRMSDDAKLALDF